MVPMFHEKFGGRALRYSSWRFSVVMMSDEEEIGMPIITKRGVLLLFFFAVREESCQMK